MKVTKKQKRAIIKLAAIFPKVALNESHRVNQLGADIIAAGIKGTADGKPLKMDEVYTGYQQGGKFTNHEKRMEKVYAFEGRKGIVDYGKKIIKEEHHAEWEHVVFSIFDFEEKGVVTAPYETAEVAEAVEGKAA
jgi:hypothetical protein